MAKLDRKDRHNIEYALAAQADAQTRLADELWPVDRDAAAVHYRRAESLRRTQQAIHDTNPDVAKKPS